VVGDDDHDPRLRGRPRRAPALRRGQPHAQLGEPAQRADGHGEIGVPSYRFVRRYFERRPQAPLSLRQVDPLIRQLTQYRDLIDRITQE